MAVGYDLLNAVMWLPSGSDRLRRRFVAALDVNPGDRVLELGCGTGLVTRQLCLRGALVTAVDRSAQMLAAARRRAPRAEFLQGDVATIAVEGNFDHVVLAFVLHELTPAERVRSLRRSGDWLGTGGRIGILDWGRPPGCVRGAMWATTMRRIEPSVAHDVLEDGLERAIDASDLSIDRDFPLAAGRARTLAVVRSPSMPVGVIPSRR